MAAVLLQISIGISTVHFGVPLPLATLHNAGAAFLVLCVVTLLRALWPAHEFACAASPSSDKPAPMVAMVPLQHADPPR